MGRNSRFVLMAPCALMLSLGCEVTEDLGDNDAGTVADAGELADGGVQGDGDGDQDAEAPHGILRRTSGSAVAVTADDSTVVLINRRTGRGGAGSTQIESYGLKLEEDPPALKLGGAYEVPGANALVIGADDDSVFTAGADELVKIAGLKSGHLTRAAAVHVGSESRGLALSPTGARLYVANWADGTVSVVDTSNLAVLKQIDLNVALASSGVLGASATARPALAHPFALAITNDGDRDDGDETLYVTEYFSQARSEGVPSGDAAFDEGRQGVVYAISTASAKVDRLIYLAPVADTGFVDANGVSTGCFPNQLNAATINEGRLYVTSVCESPRGPVGPVLDPATGAATNTANFKTQVHGAIFVVDTTTNTELPAQGVLLPRAFTALYDKAKLPDDASRRIPLIPNDIAFVPDTHIGYVTAYGSDAVFRVEFKADGELLRVGSSTQNFIDLVAEGQSPGRLPYGLAITNAGDRALVVNEYTRNVSMVAFATQNVVGTADMRDVKPTGDEARINDGRRFFVTGLGRWSFKGQAWNSCESCHPNALTDNVTWFFGRGPRQTTSLDGTFSSSDPNQQRVLNWAGIFDELHDFELNTRGNSGGVGAIVHKNSVPPALADRIVFDGTVPLEGQLPTPTPQAGLNGSTISLMPGGPTAPVSVQDDWDRIAAYVREVRAPRAPSNLSDDAVTRGRALFETNNCAGCHGTDMWTISRVFYTPGEDNNAANGALRTSTYQADASFPAQLNPASAGADRKAPLRFVGANTADNAANDQINCVLRAVGTFPETPDASQSGVSPEGVLVREVRQNMSTLAQGATGFNPPSLLGMVTGAPYFHAGNARTLEEAFADTFAAHHTAFSSNFLTGGAREGQVSDLVQFLLSIDEQSAPVSVPDGLGFDPQLCPEHFP